MADRTEFQRQKRGVEHARGGEGERLDGRNLFERKTRQND